MSKYTLGDLLELKRGQDLTKDDMHEGFYPVVGSNGIIGTHDSFNVGAPCITVGRSGTIGNVHYYNKDCWAHNTCLYISDFKNNNPLYLYYLLKNIDLTKVATSTGVPTLNRNFVYPITTIATTNVDEQNNIANVLSALDDKIANNNAISNQLESLMKTIYDYWFLQFEFPNEEGKPYKSSGGKMAWNEELKREIPKGWSSGTLSDYGNIIGGGTPSTTNETYYTEPYKGIAWITPYDLANTTDKYIEHGARDITKEGLQKSSAVLMPAGSVLMTSRAPIGYLAIPQNEICTNQGFKSIVPNKKYGKEFVYHSLSALMPYIKSQGVGSTFSEISGTTLKNLPCLCPDIIISNKFEKLVEKFAIKQSICESENRELISLRDFLLPLLMNGQVTFRDDKETVPLEK